MMPDKFLQNVSGLRNRGPTLLLFVLLLPLVLFSGCKRSNTSTMTLTLSPKTVTALNAVVWTCADKEALKKDGTHTASGAAAAASFRQMIITWSNKNADLLVYAMRITGKNTDGSQIDITLSGQNFWASVIGLVDTSIQCSFCYIPRSTDANPTWTQTVTEAATFVNYAGTTYADGLGCAPVITGIIVPKNQAGDVLVNLKATLLAYSTDSDGNVNNEYATFPFTVKLQAPPL